MNWLFLYFPGNILKFYSMCNAQFSEQEIQ